MQILSDWESQRPAEGEEVDISDAFMANEMDITANKTNIMRDWGNSPAANAAVRAVVRGTNAWDLIQDGKLDLNEGLFRNAMDTGMEASTHIHDVASGEHEGIDPDAMRAIPVLKPPKRSFCPNVVQIFTQTLCCNGENGVIHLVKLFQCN